MTGSSPGAPSAGLVGRTLLLPFGSGRPVESIDQGSAERTQIWRAGAVRRAGRAYRPGGPRSAGSRPRPRPRIRAALRAESLRPPVAALGGLDVGPGAPLLTTGCPAGSRHWRGRRCRHPLTVGAVRPDLRRIDLGLEADRAAMVMPGDFHRPLPADPPTDCNPEIPCLQGIFAR